MAGKKTEREQLEDLAYEGAPDGILEDELKDVAETEKQLQLENLKDSIFLEQLEYLYARGYSIERLRQIIEEAKKE